jgi:hypothetical protein
MRTINESPEPQIPVRVEFSFTTVAPIVPFAVNGITYPYKHQADEEPPNPTKGGRTSDSRYVVETTGTNSPITFDAVDSESLGNPKVIIPTGVFVLEYLWKFGDGFEAKGPTVTHTYLVPDPFTTVKLHVTDSRGLRWSSSKTLNLTLAHEGHIAVNKIIA